MIIMIFCPFLTLKFVGLGSVPKMELATKFKFENSLITYVSTNLCMDHIAVIRATMLR